MHDANKQVLKDANAAITRGDYEGFLAHCTEDTLWVFEGDQTLRGKQAVREWMAKTYIEPPRFDVRHLVAEDDHVVALGEITVKDAQGKAVTSSYCDAWRLHEGKLAELHAFVVEK